MTSTTATSAASAHACAKVRAPKDLAAYLTDVAVDRMGITPIGSREAATRLEAWFNDVM